MVKDLTIKIKAMFRDQRTFVVSGKKVKPSCVTMGSYPVTMVTGLGSHLFFKKKNKCE